MPWHTARSDQCPGSKPYAVIRDSDGSVEGCHATQEAARRQMAALYAQEALNDMQHKSFDVIETKADGESGTFEALVSVFGNVDHVGDRILPGAFTKTLDQWRTTGDPLPVILSHNWDDPHAHIGIADPKDVKQTPKGLVVKGQLDISDNAVAKQVYKLLKRRSLKAFSFGYTVPEGGQSLAEDGANDISELDLVEVGPTLKGANPEAQLQAVKSALEQEAEVEPRDEATLRKESDKRERERIAEELPETKQAPMGGPVRILNSMIEMAQEYIDAEAADPEDISVMRDVLSTLRDLLAKDQGEGEKSRLYVRVVSEDELAGTKSGELKAVWSTAYVNNLPDSSFLYIQSGGEKDDEGKTTPRSLRFFPYKDAEGNIDLPHLRNALARIPQSNLPQDVKDRLTRKAQQILDQQKSEPAPERQEAAPRPPDELRKRSDQAVLEIQSGGASLRRPPKARREPEPEPTPEAELRRRSREVMLQVLTGERNDSKRAQAEGRRAEARREVEGDPGHLEEGRRGGSGDLERGAR